MTTEHEDYEERAAILEYEAGYSREEAERLAREMTGNENGTKTQT